MLDRDENIEKQRLLTPLIVAVILAPEVLIILVTFLRSPLMSARLNSEAHLESL